MGKITHKRYEELVQMGRIPINLPYEIYFNGNEVLQKTPGSHHIPEYRQTGTYNHPNVKEHRKRVAMDYAKALLNGKMNAVSLKKAGGRKGIVKKLKEHGLRISESDQEIIDMNAKFLEQEYEARKQTENEKREKLGREEITQEPETGNESSNTITGAQTKGEPHPGLQTADVEKMSYNQLTKELKERNIPQQVGQNTEEKRQLLLESI